MEHSVSIKSKILDAFKKDNKKPYRSNYCIAKDIGCSYDYVKMLARQHGRSTRRVGNQQFSVLIFDRLKEDPDQSYIELAKSLGCNKSLVSKVAMGVLGLPKRTHAKCGKKITVPHNLTALAPPDIVPAE